MTDAERLEKWYKEQNFLPGVKSIFKNVYDNYYVQDHEEPVFHGIPAVYKVVGDNFIYVHGKEKEHVLWVYAGSPEPVKPEEALDFLK